MMKVSFFRITTLLLFLLLSVRAQAVDTVIAVGYCPYGATCMTGAADIETYMTAYYRSIPIPASALPVIPTPAAPPESEVDKVEIVGIKDDDVSDDSTPTLVNDAYNSFEQQARMETEAIKKEQQDKYCKSQPSVINLKQQTCIYDATRFTTGEANKCSNFSFDLSWIAGISYSPSCRSYWAGEQATQVQLCNVLAAEAVAALAKECP